MAAKTKTPATHAQKAVAKKAAAKEAAPRQKVNAALTEAINKAAKGNGKPAEMPAPAKREPKPLAAEVVELIALLKTKKGATNEEAAKTIKGFKSSRDVRAAIRDKVRKLHSVTKQHDGERGGVVFHIKS